MLMVAILDDIRCLIVPSRYKKKGAKRASIAWLADDIACMAFTLANLLTLMYFVIQLTHHGEKVMDPSKARWLSPWWLTPSMHILNSIIAWADLGLISVVGGYQQGRSFNLSAGVGCISLALSYSLVMWLFSTHREQVQATLSQSRHRFGFN